ncbi:MAG TPA: RluA family pseudouridine synthase [Burkholderiaceae bacterium]|nr:RluA family pseudouridine synthase [Burkholderiaceae bacterium]
MVCGAPCKALRSRGLIIEPDYRNAPALARAGSEDEDLEAAVEVRRFTVGASAHAQRLDKVLVAYASEFSRSHLQHLIERGHVSVDGMLARTSSRRLRAGQAVAVELVPTDESRAFVPEPMALTVVYEDDALLVIDKPAGLVVHPAPGHWRGTLLNGLLAHHPGAMALPRAGIVHRLDKDTSGLMVVAKTLTAMTALVRAIAARTVSREYRALVHGRVAMQAFSIDAPIGRDPQSRVRMAVVASGRPARTDVQAQACGGGVSALWCRLHTGRTHQIRVHLASRGHPLVADALYGGPHALGLQRQALHAARLAFAHPGDARLLAFESPLPSDLQLAWDRVCA